MKIEEAITLFGYHQRSNQKTRIIQSYSPLLQKMHEHFAERSFESLGEKGRSGKFVLLALRFCFSNGLVYFGEVVASVDFTFHGLRKFARFSPRPIPEELHLSPEEQRQLKFNYSFPLSRIWLKIVKRSASPSQPRPQGEADSDVDNFFGEIIS